MSTRLITTLGALALVVASGACSDGVGPTAQRTSLDTPRASSAARIELTAVLTGANDGKARFRSEGDEQQLQIEVEDLVPGTAVEFIVDGSSVGTATADALGVANFNLNTEKGGVFPAGLSIQAGSQVSASVDGATIASGQLF